MADDVYRRAREALKLTDRRAWSHWLSIGAAMAAARAAAFVAAGTDRPVGRAYNTAFGHVLRRERLDGIDSATRNHLFKIMRDLTAIEAWRVTLDSSVRGNHPTNVLRSYLRATKPRGQTVPKPPVKISDLRRELAAARKRIAELEAGGATKVRKGRK